jgi:hypothetical protein
MSRDLKYEYENIIYNKKCIELKLFNIKCKNYKICESILPEWWYDWKKNYLCIGCNVTFGNWNKDNKYHFGKGILPISNNLKCSLCSNIDLNITHPRCDHKLCLKCFKLCYYGPKFKKPKPYFPFPTIEKEYYNDIRNPKFLSKKLSIKIYNENLDRWYIAEENHLSSSEECHICHK